MRRQIFAVLFGVALLAASASGVTVRGEFDPKASTDYKVDDQVTFRGRAYNCVKYVPRAKVAYPSIDPEHWSAVDRSVVTLATGTVDLKAVASTTVLTVPAGEKFIVVGADIQIVTGTAITTGATVRLGSGTSDALFLASTVLASGQGAGVVNSYAVATPHAILNAADVIVFKVTSGAVGTAQTAIVHVRGYYQ